MADDKYKLADGSDIPAPIPDELDPEEQVHEAILNDSLRTLALMQTLIKEKKLKPSRGFRLLSAQVKATQRVLAEVAIEAGPDDFDDDDEYSSNPRYGRGRPRLRTGGNDNIVDTVASTMEPVTRAQRVQALTAALESASRAEDHELAAQLREEVQLLLGVHTRTNEPALRAQVTVETVQATLATAQRAEEALDVARDAEALEGVRSAVAEHMPHVRWDDVRDAAEGGVLRGGMLTIGHVNEAGS